MDIGESISYDHRTEFEEGALEILSNLRPPHTTRSGHHLDCVMSTAQPIDASCRVALRN